MITSNEVVLLVGGSAVIAWLLWSNRSRVPITQAGAAVESGHAVLIDVREPAEWATGMAARAHGLPLSDLRIARERWQPFLEAHRGRRLFLYCQSGARSGLAAALLRREGFDAVNVGSFHAWRRAGWAVATPPSTDG